MTVRREGDPARVRLTAASLPPLELLGLGLDRDRLAAVVRAGSGRVHTSPQAFAEVVRRIRGRAYRPVALVLVAAAGVLSLAMAVLRLIGRG